MALSSMTGFARTAGDYEDHRWHWELKSVNGRGLDMRLRLPPGFDGLEQKLRAALAIKLHRGNCQANLQLDQTGATAQIRINQEALGAALAAVRALQQHADMGPASPDGILALRGVLETTDQTLSDDARTALEQAMVDNFTAAVAALRAARDQEGGKIETIIASQIDRIEELAAQAEMLAVAEPEAIRARLKTQIAELMSAEPGLPEDRLAQEVALLATKQDVREELDRLVAHVAQARELLADSGPVGRRLDFLTQEFNREANTLCSKAGNVELTRIGLELKAVIDQLREQVQNIE